MRANLSSLSPLARAHTSLDDDAPTYSSSLHPRGARARTDRLRRVADATYRARARHRSRSASPESSRDEARAEVLKPRGVPHTARSHHACASSQTDRDTRRGPSHAETRAAIGNHAAATEPRPTTEPRPRTVGRRATGHIPTAHGSTPARRAQPSPWMRSATRPVKAAHDVRSGGEMRITPSPRTKSIAIWRFDVLMISSHVSSSTSVDVTISSTSPSTMFKCWSYAWRSRGGRTSVHIHWYGVAAAGPGYRHDPRGLW